MKRLHKEFPASCSVDAQAAHHALANERSCEDRVQPLPCDIRAYAAVNIENNRQKSALPLVAALKVVGVLDLRGVIEEIAFKSLGDVGWEGGAHDSGVDGNHAGAHVRAPNDEVYLRVRLHSCGVARA